MNVDVDPITGLPLCERCYTHWYGDRPRPANPVAYMARYHELGHGVVR